MEQRASSYHEAYTLTPIGGCMPNIYTNSRTKLGKISKSAMLTYKSSPLHSEPNIIHATDILIEERIDKISTMISKSVSDFHAQLTQYTTELTKRIKRATMKADYGFVRKPEL